MPKHYELAAQLLGDAAAFFETLAEQNEPLREQMTENAAVFREVGHLTMTNPMGEIQGHFSNGGHSHEGGCCGGHGHDHGHNHGDEPCADEGKKEGCDSKGGCGCH
jgi:FKBP-type peptidyl-prolyl cis-trans isomerase SlyD